ncbi:oocyte-specific histone RNA stem-loop-binding protein 2-like isoform X2 [Mesoplodon densirostris]|uniref:oocyte-specific histone RNA stem-loop-binding protein 2-like isoform X2 n=1 Tax=Mesoplodon densirostris TaxID=48708 RepID=UPI0028DCF23E|nr:oocyte-specific histone RNA stem-loop-binding protein 2-like isoform X2 [Mesoplodon densirostris]
MEHLTPVWQMLRRDRICFPRKEVREESLSSRIEMVSVGVSTEPCHARWEVETDAIVLQRRQKQIDYGKRTPGYQCFLQQVPKAQRQPGLHPQTPNKNRRWGMDNLLEPMDSTPLDDWLQTLEPSENLDGEQKGAQFAGLVAPASSLPWLCEEDPHHWLYLLADHNYLSVPDLSGTQNI